MSKPSVRKHPAGGWVALCAPPCRAMVRTETWAEAMRLVRTFRHEKGADYA